MLHRYAKMAAEGTLEEHLIAMGLTLQDGKVVVVESGTKPCKSKRINAVKGPEEEGVPESSSGKKEKQTSRIPGDTRVERPARKRRRGKGGNSIKKEKKEDEGEG